MQRAHLLCLLAFFASAGLGACSGTSSGCKYDVDCPGTQRCSDGVCTYPNPDEPCQGVQCAPGEVCVEGICLDEDTDADSDGWSVLGDCDDSDPAIHPTAPEVCNERDDDCDGATDEDLFCGDDCVPVDAPPADQPPVACDDATPCDRCYLYESALYYCRRLGQAEPAWLAVPQATPCGQAQHCDLMSCEGDRFFHCDASVGAYVAGAVPTADAEDCNGLDDNCDGATDEPGAEAGCPARDHASAACLDGACRYTCQAGFHSCQDLCLDDRSPNSCGARCTPCLPPDDADATCEDGACGFTCHPGHLEQANACIRCDTEAACGPACTPCDSGTTCCTDGCYDLGVDPDHCGTCDQSCPDQTDTCCTDGCCPESYPQCCDQHCCAAGDQCCQGSPRYCCEAGGSCCTDHCCPSAHSTCCQDGCCDTDASCCGGGCCPGGTTCCGDQSCCSPGETCCTDGCCPAGHGVCCGDGCCQDGTSCCNALYCCVPGETCCPDGCCPQGYPVCCTGGCCPSGTTCCGDSCCSKKTGLPVGPKRHTDRRPSPGLRPAPDGLER